MAKDQAATAQPRRGAAAGAAGDDWSTLLAELAQDPTEDAATVPKQDRSRRRRQEILRASLRVFARDGISRARIGDIAAEAGMPVSSVYEYFPSKEDIAYAVPSVFMARFFREYEGLAPATASARERLRAYFWHVADFARRNPDWARTLYLEIWPSVLVTDSPARHSFDNYVRVILRLLREGEAAGEWPPGPDHYETAAILNGSVNQVIITWLLYRRPRDLMGAVNSIIARLLDTLLVTTPYHDLHDDGRRLLRGRTAGRGFPRRPGPDSRAG